MSDKKRAIFGVWSQLTDPAHSDLLMAVRACDRFDQPAIIDRLRRLGELPLVQAAIEMVVAQRKLSGRIEGNEAWLADMSGSEQVSSTLVARHKAQRYVALFNALGLSASDRPMIFDLCCGIGGDSVELSRIAPLCAIDHDPKRAWMAQHQLAGLAASSDSPCFSAHTAVADVTSLSLAGLFYHIDPARREGSRRLWRLADAQPGPDFLRRLAEQADSGAMKLSPAVDFDQLPLGEVEIIGVPGRLVQAVLWTGRLARFQRTATQISAEGQVTQLSGAADGHRWLPVVEPLRYLLLVDPAIERAQLLGELCDRLNVGMIHPSLGLLTSETLPDSPWVTPFEWVTTLPWRLKKVRQWLKANDGGLVEVKTRDRIVDPDQVQRQLRGQGQTTYTVFIHRHDRQVLTMIARRLNH